MKNIIIHHDCEGGIEKSVPRITDWHHEARPIDDKRCSRGTDFLFASSHEFYTRFFFLPLLNPHFIIEKHEKRLPDNPENAEM